jgi:hypothetical protein
MVGMVMDRTSQPDMRPRTSGTGATGSRPDLGPEERTIGAQAFKKSSAFTRWTIMIACVGLGTAAVVAIVLTALYTLVDSSL